VGRHQDTLLCIVRHSSAELRSTDSSPCSAGRELGRLQQQQQQQRQGSQSGRTCEAPHRTGRQRTARVLTRLRDAVESERGSEVSRCSTMGGDTQVSTQQPPPSYGSCVCCCCQITAHLKLRGDDHRRGRTCADRPQGVLQDRVGAGRGRLALHMKAHNLLLRDVAARLVPIARPLRLHLWTISR
jgi:hypothetical protein